MYCVSLVLSTFLPETIRKILKKIESYSNDGYVNIERNLFLVLCRICYAMRKKRHARRDPDYYYNSLSIMQASQRHIVQDDE